MFVQEYVYRAQRDNPDLAPIIGALNTPSGNPNFVLRNRTLYRRVWFKKRNKEPHLIVVPAALRTEILHAAHASPEGGHIGQHETLKKIQERFWRPKMHGQIRSYVDSCEVCCDT